VLLEHRHHLVADEEAAGRRRIANRGQRLQVAETDSVSRECPTHRHTFDQLSTGHHRVVEPSLRVVIAVQRLLTRASRARALR
jgi:hypothetical protein